VVKPIKIGAIAIGLGALLLSGVLWRGNATAPPDPDRALVASLRSEPTVYNRYLDGSAAADLISLLTNATLVRVNRSTDAIEPALAERWALSPDGLTYTLSLRHDVRFSDGAPFTAADVLFTARVLFDTRVDSPLASTLRVDGKPLTFAAPDDFTVTVSLPSAFAPGLRLLDNMPILPRHKLEEALNAGSLREKARVGSTLDELAGLGPFKLVEHVAGQRLVFIRNPYYWRKDEHGRPLPYLDRLTVAILPDQNTEAVRLGAGEIDLMSNGDIRPDDYATFKRLSDEGRLKLMDAGIGLDPNFLWFNLTPQGKVAPWLRDRRARQAISFAVDRQVMADTVYLGAAVPIYGPVSPGNKVWFSPSAPQYPHDASRARELLAAAGLSDRDSDGMLEDAVGRPARFSVMTQKGNTLRERAAAMIQEHLRLIGISVDIVALDVRTLQTRWMSGDYESIYMGAQASATDPALNADFWLSSGPFHFWNPGQRVPATEWEARMDAMMRRQAAASALEERQQLFAGVQQIMGEELPAIYFVAPRVTIAVSPRVSNAAPVQQAPQLLWSADTLTVSGR
jgi:peptide/nickel transport system substrate-binding protein